MGRQWAALSLRRSNAGHRIVFRTGDAEQVVRTDFSGAIRFRVEVQDGGLCSFSYALPDGQFVAVGEKFQSTEGHWIGAKVGIYSASQGAQQNAGFTDFQYFRFDSV
jgi:hypothetical protein